MASVRGTRGVIIAGLVLIVIFAAAGWYLALDRDLSEPPRREAGPLAPGVPISQMALNVTLPFDRLTAEAEAAAPPESSDGSGDGPEVCTTFGTKLCVGTRYDYSATRGPLQFSAGPDNSIRISMPVKVRGHGTLKGTGVHLLHLEAKRFEVSTNAYADLTVGLSNDWCPQVATKVDYSNVDTGVEIASRATVSVADLFENTLRTQLQQMAERAAATIQCDELRRAVQGAWVARSFPLPLPADPRGLHVNLEPQSIGFAGVEVTSTSARILLNVAERVWVSDTAPDSGPKPLPAWKPAPLQPGSLKLAVPLRITYEGLESRLSSLVHQRITLNTPQGEAALDADRIRVYPAGDRVAVGVHIHAQLPGRSMTTRGWLYVTARPVVSPEGRRVGFTDITYSKILDGDIADILTVMMDSKIRERLTSAGQFDLSATLAKAKQLLDQGLAVQSKDIAVDLGQPELRLGRIIPGGGFLFIEGLFSSGASLVPAVAP